MASASGKQQQQGQPLQRKSTRPLLSPSQRPLKYPQPIHSNLESKSPPEPGLGTAHEGAKFLFENVPPVVGNGASDCRYWSENFAAYVARSAEISEAFMVCDEMLRCATSLYPHSTASDYSWNDRFQLLLRQSISCWQSAATWASIEEVSHEFYAATIVVAEQLYTNFTYGEPSTVIKNGCMFRIWGSYDEAKMFMQGFQRLTQVIFEQNIDALHTPVTILITMHGVFMTITALPPVAEVQAIPYAGTGTLLAHIMLRLHRALFLPPDVPPLAVHRGCDGRWYLLSFRGSLVTHKRLKCRFPVPMLRAHYIRGLPNETMEAFAEAVVAADVAQTLLETVEVTLKAEGRGVQVVELMNRDLVCKALKHHGANTRLLFRIIARLGEFLERVRVNPKLGLARKRPPIRKKDEDYEHLLSAAGLDPAEIVPSASPLRPPQPVSSIAASLSSQRQLRTASVRPSSGALRAREGVPGSTSPAAPSALRSPTTVAQPSPPLLPHQRRLSIAVDMEELASEGSTTPTGTPQSNAALTPTPHSGRISQYRAFKSPSAAPLEGARMHSAHPSGKGGGVAHDDDDDGGESPAPLKSPSAALGQQKQRKAVAFNTSHVEVEPRVPSEEMKSGGRGESDFDPPSDDSPQPRELGAFKAFASQRRLSVAPRGAHAAPAHRQDSTPSWRKDLPRPKLCRPAGAFLTGLTEEELGMAYQGDNSNEQAGTNDSHSGGERSAQTPPDVNRTRSPASAPAPSGSTTPKLSIAQVAMLKRKMQLARQRAQQRQQADAVGGTRENQLSASPSQNSLLRSPTRRELRHPEGVEVVKVLAPTRKPVLQPTEIEAPIISERAVLLAIRCCQIEMAVRCFKAIVRAELVAPQNNCERHFTHTVQRRIDLINRVAKAIYDTDGLFFEEVNRVARVKFDCPPDFVIPVDNVLSQFLIRHAPPTIGAVYDAAFGRFVRLKPIFKESTLAETPLPLRLVLESHSNLPQATRLVADEWEGVKSIYAPGSITRLCALQRCAYMGMLIMIKLAKTILEDLYAEAEEHRDRDPYAPLTTGGLLTQLYTLTSDRANAETVVGRHKRYLREISFDVDLPFRSERELVSSQHLHELGDKASAAQTILDSVHCDELMRDRGMLNVLTTRRHFEKLLLGAEYCFANRQYKNAQHLVNEAMVVAEELPPTEISQGDLSQAFLQMPLKGDTRDELVTLRAVAEASVAFHEKHFGKMAPETCTARNILANFFAALNEDIPGELRGDVLLGLQVLSGVGDAIIEDPPQKSSEQCSNAPSSMVSNVASPHDETASRPTPGETGRSADIAAAAAAAGQQRRVTLRVPPGHKEKHTPQVVRRFQALSDRHHAGGGLTPAQHKQLLRFRETSLAIEKIGQRTRILMRHLAEREQLWQDFGTSFIDVVEAELDERKGICAAQEGVERHRVLAAQEWQSQRAMCIMHEYFSHFITWAEHAAIIELLESEERHKGWLWERDDMRRIAVREEYLHRAVLWNVQLQTAVSHLLVRCEFLERFATGLAEQRTRRALVLEAKVATLRQWEREERRVRLRWHVGSEAFARRAIYAAEEVDSRRRLSLKEVRERERAVHFMNFIGLESGLRNLEYWEGVERQSIRTKLWNAALRTHLEVQETDQRIVVHRYELAAREELFRAALAETSFVQRILGGVREEESVGRCGVVWSMHDDTLFAVEIHEDTIRALIEHEEIETHERLHVRQRGSFIALRYTPAMKRLEMEEAQLRRSYMAQRAEELVVMLTTHALCTRARVLQAEVEHRSSIIAMLHGEAEGTFAIERAELQRIESLYRHMIVSDECDGVQRLVVREEAATRKVLRAQANGVLCALLERQHDFWWGAITREEHRAWIDQVLCGHAMPWMHISALWLSQHGFRVIEGYVQQEIWARLTISDAFMHEHVYLHCTCLEQVVRGQIVADWARGLGWIARLNEGHSAAIRRCEMHEECEYQYRCIADLLLLSWVCFEVERRKRFLLEQLECHERERYGSSLRHHLQHAYASAGDHLRIYEMGCRSQLLREEVAAWDYLNRSLHNQRVVFQQRNAAAAQLLTQWWLLVEPLHRTSLLGSEAILRRRLLRQVDIQVLRLRPRDELQAQSLSVRRRIVCEEHVSFHAVSQLAFVVQNEHFHRAVRALHERGCRTELQEYHARQYRASQLRAGSLLEIEIYEEEFRRSLRMSEGGARLTILQQEEGAWRFGLIAVHEVQSISALVPRCVEPIAMLALSDAAKANFHAYEELQRLLVADGEQRSRGEIAARLHRIRTALTGRLAVQLAARETVRRFELLVELHIEAEHDFRCLLVEEYYALFFSRLEANRKRKRDLLETDEATASRLMIAPFLSTALCLVPIEEQCSRRFLCVISEGFARRQVIIGCAFVPHKVVLVKLACAVAAQLYSLQLREYASLVKFLATREKQLIFERSSRQLLEDRESCCRCELLFAEFRGLRGLMFVRFFLMPLQQWRELLVVKLEEPYWRRVLWAALLSADKQVRLAEIEHRECVFRNMVLRRRRVWERQNVYFAWRIGMWALHRDELVARISVVRCLVTTSELSFRQQLGRRHVILLEEARRRTLLVAQQVAERAAIEAVSALASSWHWLYGAELNIRASLQVHQQRARSGIVADAIATHGWSVGAGRIAGERARAMLKLLFAFECDCREAYGWQWMRESLAVVSRAFLLCFVLPVRQCVEGDEREARLRIVEWWHLPQREVHQRVRITEEREAQWEGLVRKERAWRQVTLQWERREEDERAAATRRVARSVETRRPLGPIARAPRDATAFLLSPGESAARPTVPQAARANTAALAPLTRVPPPKRSHSLHRGAPDSPSIHDRHGPSTSAGTQSVGNLRVLARAVEREWRLAHGIR